MLTTRAGDGEKERERQKEEWEWGCQKGKEHKKEVSDERKMIRQQRDKEKKKKSRSGYDDMHRALPHRSSSHGYTDRCRVAKWEESPKHLKLSAPPPPILPGNM